MNEQRRQCLNCGFLFANEESFYHTSEFAAYWSRKPLFAASWCFKCTHITIWKSKKILGLINSGVVIPKESMKQKEFMNHPLGKLKDKETGFVHMHMLRLIWFCLKDKARKSDDENETAKTAFGLALEKLSPPDIATLLFLLQDYNNFVSLERTFIENCVLNEWMNSVIYNQWFEFYKNNRVVADIESMFSTLQNRTR